MHAELIARLKTCLREVSDDLASALEAQYAGMLDHPAMRRRYDRDMCSVIDARALLRALDTEGGKP